MSKTLIFMLLILVSCIEEKSSPESSLKEFIEARIGKVVTREFVLQRVTGKMKESFENMADSDFAKFADLRNVEKNNFKILSKSCQKERCFITYTISYGTDNDKDKTVHQSEVKKIAELVQIDGIWLIADVSNIKTYHESLEPINPLE